MFQDAYCKKTTSCRFLVPPSCRCLSIVGGLFGCLELIKNSEFHGNIWKHEEGCIMKFETGKLRSILYVELAKNS